MNHSDVANSGFFPLPHLWNDAKDDYLICLITYATGSNATLEISHMIAEFDYEFDPAQNPGVSSGLASGFMHVWFPDPVPEHFHDN